jgi:hypothetical protein
VVQPDRGDARAALDALERQTRPPNEVVVLGPGEDARAALDRGAAWLWLLEGDVAPEEGALEALLDGLERMRSLPAPVLLASKVLTPEGSQDPASKPVVYTLDLDLAVAACERRLLLVRIVPRGSVLVHRRGVDAAAPGAGADGSEWSARLLKREPGLLVPQSVAIRRGAREPRPSLGTLARLVVGDALRPPERTWLAFRLLEEAIAASRWPARASRRAARARSTSRSRQSDA